MSEEDKLFKDIILRDRLIGDCDLEYKSEDGNYRLYVAREDSSFWAHAVGFVSCEMIGDSGVLDWRQDGSLVVSTIFEVTAYFDGVRHLEWNRNGGDMDGYIYCPEMAEIIAMLQKVRDIEVKVCTSCDGYTG